MKPLKVTGDFGLKATMICMYYIQNILCNYHSLIKTVNVYNLTHVGKDELTLYARKQRQPFSPGASHVKHVQSAPNVRHLGFSGNNCWKGKSPHRSRTDFKLDITVCHSCIVKYGLEKS